MKRSSDHETHPIDGETDPHIPWWKAVLVAGIVASLYWVAAWWIAGGFHKVDRVGQMGDAFAPISGALSAAALFLLIISNRDQRESLRVQREDLRLQREESELQRKELAEQSKALREQLMRMDEQRIVMERSNRIARAQAALDAFSMLFETRKRLADLRDDVRGRAARVWQSAHGTNRAPDLSDFDELLERPDHDGLARWFDKFEPGPISMFAIRVAHEYADTLNALRHAESVAREMQLATPTTDPH